MSLVLVPRKVAGVFSGTRQLFATRDVKTSAQYWVYICVMRVQLSDPNS